MEKHGASCEDIGNVWDAFVDAFVGTLHAQGGAGCASRAGPSSVKKDDDNGNKRGQDMMATMRREARERVVTIGDLHGDLEKSVSSVRVNRLER